MTGDEPGVVVVGSGHTGVAAAAALAARGVNPLVVDVGTGLDPSHVAAVAELAAADPVRWDPLRLRTVTANPTVHDRVPRRLAFGSAHVYADDDPQVPLRRDEPGAPVPTTARGGFSTVWGAAVLAADDCDLTGWPVRRADLEPSYREVLRRIPLSGRHDGLEEHFPLLHDDPAPLTLPPGPGSLLDRLEQRWAPGEHPDDARFAVGQARLAVDAAACRYCGHCLSGCAYGAIQDSGRDLDALVASGLVRYRPGLVVRRVEQRGEEVRLHCDPAGGGGSPFEVRARRVFLAAGALGTTRIVLESGDHWDRPVRLASTQGFVLPCLDLRSPGGWPAENTLAAVFVELKVPGSPHWIHVQLNSPNEIVRQRLGVDADGPPLRRRALRPLVDRSVVALCNLHSDHAGHHLLRLVRTASGPPELAVSSVPAPGFPNLARRAAAALLDRLRPVGVLGSTRGARGLGGPPGSWHVGGSLPMGGAGPLGTDDLGRLPAWDRVHVVDSSVFPSVPATTVAMLAMANAVRTVDAVRRDTEGRW